MLYSLQKNTIQQNSVQISQTTVELHDSILSSDLNVEHYEFYQLDSTQQKVQKSNETRIEVFITLSDKKQEVVRNIDTIMTAISNTGGFMSILFVGIQILIGGIQEKLFFQSLISEMYLNHDKNSAKKLPSSKVQLKSKLNTSQTSQLNKQAKELKTQNSQDPTIDLEQSIEFDSQQKYKSTKQNQKYLLDQIQKYTSELKRPIFSMWDNLKYSIRKVIRYAVCKVVEKQNR
eukprot:403345544